MKLKKFLIESDISKALDLPEPEVGEDYPSEKVKRYIDIIDKALESMKSKEENDSNDAVVADLRDKKKKWSNTDKATKPVKVKKDIPPEQQQADDPDVANPPPEGEEEPPPEEEEPPPEEEEEPKNGKNGKKKKKKVPPQFQKKEDYDLMLMTPFEKNMKEGIFDKKMAGMKADLAKRYGKSGSKLVDSIYNQLIKIKEFKNLSMDRQGEISVAVQKMIGK